MVIEGIPQQSEDTNSRVKVQLHLEKSTDTSLFIKVPTAWVVHSQVSATCGTKAVPQPRPVPRDKIPHDLK